MFFLPIRKRKCFLFYKADFQINKNIYRKDIKKPFFKMIDDAGTTDFFIDAIMKGRVYDAENYLSKVFCCDTDWDKVKKIFKDAEYYKQLTSVKKNNFSLYEVRSVMIKNKENKKSEIIHFYMVKEPDSFSRWKIYKITKEG